MKKISKNILKMGMAGVLALLFLSIFTIVYNYTGIHIANLSGATDYKWAGGQLKTTMVEGFAWIKMDSDGFNNSFNVSENTPVDILLMGSSHMDAVEVNKNENTAFILNQKLPGMVTYNIGMSAHDIYRCANNLKTAVNVYNPRKYVVVETDTVDLTSEGIQRVLNGEMEPIRSYDSGLLYTIQKWCPAIKTIYKQISDWRNTDRVYDPIGEHASNGEIVAFIRKMKTDCGEDRILIICYQPEYHIDSYGKLEFDENHEYAEIFARACTENDVIFIDMTRRFFELYEENYILAHGFYNTAIGIGHLNKFGHQEFADALVESIERK